MGITVPVVVDDTKDYASFAMTRCNYLTIQCDEPSGGWFIRLSDSNLRFFLLGLAGILTAPFGGGHFEDPSQLDDLFERIEAEKDLYIDVDDVWVPNEILVATEGPLDPGTVYRLDADLFALAYRFREGLIGADEYLGITKDLSRSIEHSEDESSVLRDWHWHQVDIAKDLYHRSSAQGLVLETISQGPGLKP